MSNMKIPNPTMGKSLMHHLYFGHLIPWERERTQDPDYAPINQKVIDIEAYFHDTLSPDDYKKLEEMINLRAQSSSIENADAFSYGMSMGALLMMEILNYNERQLSGAE